jgi:hypothetical protein
MSSRLEKGFISIQPPYSMRRRTIPRADTRKRHVYYDWDQRPCPSPPLPNSWDLTRSDVPNESSKTSSGVPRQPWVDKKSFCVKYSTRSKHWTTVIVSVVRLVHLCTLYTIQAESVIIAPYILRKAMAGNEENIYFTS